MRDNSGVSDEYDAVVIGAGPNGLAAAVELARNGWSVVVFEAAATVGGGTRTASLIDSSVVHDVCSAVHIFGAASPFFRSLDLASHGLAWEHAPIDVAHPLDGGWAATAQQSLEATVESLGDDGPRYRRLIADWDRITPDILRPLMHVPRHPLALARFGLPGLLPASQLTRYFDAPEAAALLAGCAAHSMVPLDRPLTTAAAMALLSAGHHSGWPFARGGSQAIADALASLLESLGGEIEVGHPVRSLDDLPPCRAVLFDTAPGAIFEIAGSAVPSSLAGYRHGPGTFKIDYVLSEPVPWAAPACREAGTVHVGGTLAEVAAAEADVGAGRHSDRPFVLVSQPGVADPTPSRQRALWAYCHMPAGSDVDCTDAIDAQIERFAPGFRDVVEGRHVMTSPQFESYNANFVGGDIAGGSGRGLQLVFRPGRWPTRDPYRVGGGTNGVPALYCCSASTPPGAGVHGMCGHNAALSALRHMG